MLILLPALLIADLGIGSVDISAGQIVSALCGGDVPLPVHKIVVDIRLVKAIVAILVGAALTISGLQMQTLFRNPLAGPYVLGLSSGASLGVALFTLGAPLLGVTGVMGVFGIAGAAWAGAAAILFVIALIGTRVKDIMVILILGMMFSSAVSAVVQILQYLSREDALKAFVIWTMGSLGDVSVSNLWMLCGGTAVGILLAIVAIKPLNTMLLGEEYARTSGIDIRRTRLIVFSSTTLLAGTVTAFCGPIGFIGVALPHVARLIFRTANHRVLLPGVILTGGCTMLVCDIVSKIYTLPINAITALVGIPVVVWVVMRNKTMAV